MQRGKTFQVNTKSGKRNVKAKWLRQTQQINLPDSYSDKHDIRHICSVRLYVKLFVGGLMFYLRYLCLFAHCGVFDFFFFVLLPVSLDCHSVLIVPSVFSNVYDSTISRYNLNLYQVLFIILVTSNKISKTYI